MADSNPQPPGGEILLYQTEDGQTRVDVRMENETVWLTQAQMAELFQTTPQNITLHIKAIYEEQELEESATCKDYLQVRREGDREVTRKLRHYNLDVIISTGYRVKSPRGTQFRIWATRRLREYLLKGFAMDDRRLKEEGGGRYFEELLARIRDIRSSEKVFWRKVLDIYATSIDYDPHAPESRRFFQQVQNKMHWAAHGHTAAELIHARADSAKPNMGVTNHPGARLLLRDVEVAKNFLDEDELNILNRIVAAYLELAELQALSHKAMTQRDWLERLDQFLVMTGRELLDHAGTITHDEAIQKARREYEAYQRRQLAAPTQAEKDFIAATEKELKALQKKKKGGK
ncbi:MAG: virulence RhuM family protein [Opitutaceae bacterium]|nr:virulence RhuM family protein [Opitutaceae bacterium]